MPKPQKHFSCKNDSYPTNGMAKLCLMHCKNNTVCMSIYIYEYIYTYILHMYIYMYPACCIFRISFDKLYPNISKENQTPTQYLGTPISGNITGGCITLPIHKPFQLVPAHFAPGPLQLADRHKDAAIRRPATWLWHRMQPTNNVTAPRLHLKINSKKCWTQINPCHVLCFCAPPMQLREL